MTKRKWTKDVLIKASYVSRAEGVQILREWADALENDSAEMSANGPAAGRPNLWVKLYLSVSCRNLEEVN